MLKSYDSGFRQRLSGVLSRILEICDPRTLTRDKLSFLASKHRIKWDDHGPLTLIAVGKASLFMALGAIDFLRREEITGGIVVAPDATLSTGTGRSIASELEAFGLEVMGAEHPYPGEGSFRAGKAVLEVVRNCRGRCLFLLSGGASSLMELNLERFPRKDVFSINKALVNSGANISEINTVRKHISTVKGGRLAQEFSGKAMLNLIISDVTGSALDTIGSGPTYPDSFDSTFGRCRDILSRYDILKVLSDEGRDFFYNGDPEYESPKELPNNDRMNHPQMNLWVSSSETQESAPPSPPPPNGGDPQRGFLRIEHHILMSNEILVEKLSSEYNYELLLPTTEPVEGLSDEWFTADSLATRLLDLCRRSLSAKPNSVGSVEKSSKFVIGGEPTVRVMGKGTGGRAQHTALLFLVGLMTDETLWKRRNDITLVTFATDGMDGNSPATGAIVDRILFEKFYSPLDESDASVRTKMLEAVKKYFYKFDSHAFFEKYDSSILTGPTGTNVLDVYLLEIA